MAKSNETKDNNVAKLPATNTVANAQNLEEMQKQMAELRAAMAAQTAIEVQNVLDIALRNKHSGTSELPSANSGYLQAKLASAMFMSLRDELVGAYMRNEASQADKVILTTRLDEDSFRSDVEKASALRSLAYYESLEERLQEIEELLTHVVASHQAAAQQIHDEDEARQQGIPETEKVFTAIPQLRWISAADRTANPRGCDTANDLERITKQCEFWLNYNS